MLRAEGFDASEDGTGRGTPVIPVAAPLTAGMAASANRQPHEQGALIPVAFDSKGSEVAAVSDGSTPTLRAMAHSGSHANAGGQLAVAFDAQAGGDTGLAIGEVAWALHGGGKHGGRAAVALGHNGGPPLWQVRRLTPRECERLQGFPDDYTLIPYRRGVAADGPRYKALGNSMAVNVMHYLGARMAAVDGMLAGLPEPR